MLILLPIDIYQSEFHRIIIYTNHKLYFTSGAQLTLYFNSGLTRIRESMRIIILYIIEYCIDEVVCSDRCDILL